MAAPYSYQTPDNYGWTSPWFWKDVWNDMPWHPQNRAYAGGRNLIESRRTQGSTPVVTVPAGAPSSGMPASAGPQQVTTAQKSVTAQTPAQMEQSAGITNKPLQLAERMKWIDQSVNFYKGQSNDDLIRGGVNVAKMYIRNPRALGDSQLLQMAEVGTRVKNDPEFANKWKDATRAIPGGFNEDMFGKVLQSGGSLGEARDNLGSVEKEYLKRVYGYNVDDLMKIHDKYTASSIQQGMQDNYWNWAWKPMQQNGISGFGDSLSRIGMGIDAYGKANNMPWLNKYTVGGGLALGTIGLGALALSGGSNDQPQQPQYPGYPNPQQNMYMNFYGGPNAFSYGTNYSRRTF